MNLLAFATRAALQAGKEVLRQYKEGFTVEIKEDGSPVTSADIAANNIIEEVLSETNISVLSEEGNKNLYSGKEKLTSYWIIDPIDGTRDFVGKTGEYCICIGLIKNQKVAAGVLYAPSLKLFYFGGESCPSRKFIGEPELLENRLNTPTFFEDLLKHSKCLPLQKAPETFTFLSSRFHLDQKTKKHIEKLRHLHPNMKQETIGSAIKLGLMAEGKATEYTRFHQMNFWDIAAGHAIAKYSGLSVLNLNESSEITYHNGDLKIEGFTIKR